MQSFYTAYTAYTATTNLNHKMRALLCTNVAIKVIIFELIRK